MITEEQLEKLKYPIGLYIKPSVFSTETINDYISIISNFPDKLKNETEHLSNEQLDTPYRPKGWTIRQVIHHCADSHMNALIRFKLTLTENTPTINPYQEHLWAELSDSKHLPIDSSYKILEGVHHRWQILLKSLIDNDFKKQYIHPEYQKTFSLEEATGLYAWHCNHHLAHITTLKQIKNWK